MSPNLSGDPTRMVPRRGAGGDPHTARPTATPRRYARDALLYVALFYIWVAVWRVQDLISILGKVHFPLLVEIAALVLFVMDRSPQRRLKWIKSPILTITMALLAIMILGLPFSLWIGNGVRFLAGDFAPALLLMTVLAAGAREISDLEWLAFGHLVGGVMYAIYVFLYCPIGTDGRLGTLVYYDSNDFALLLICSLPFAVYFLRPSVALWRRLFSLLAIGVFGIMIIKTGSRGGFLGLVTVMGYIALRYRAVPSRLRFGAVAAGVVVFAIFGSSQYWAIIGSILHPKEDYNMTEETGRKAIWLRGLGYMESNPILGVGIHTFPQAEGELSPVARQYAEYGRGIKWSVAHNSFVEVGAECGVIALALFVWRFFVALAILSRVHPGRKGIRVASRQDQAYAQALFASLLGFIVSGFFVSAEYFQFLYMLFGLILAQQAILKRRAHRLRHHVAPQMVPVGRPTVKPRMAVQWLPTGT